MSQGSIVMPVTGPATAATMFGDVNAGLAAIQSQNSGSSAPANGPSSLPVTNQAWFDTTSNPVVGKYFDGASWVVFGKLDTSAHTWTPSYKGTDLGTASTATTGTSGHTVPFLDGANTWSGVQSVNSGDLSLKGSSTGSTILNAAATASGTLTLPAATDTLVGRATTDALTNKTFNGNTWTSGTGILTLGAGKTLTASNTLTFTGTDGSSVAFGTGGTAAYQGGTLGQFASTTSLQLAGVISDETGSGSLVFATSPTLVTPVLGTPTSGTLTNCTGLPLSGHTSQAAFTFVGNNTSGSAAPTAVSIGSLTAKTTPASTDLVMISDQAASGAWKQSTIAQVVGALASGVSSIAGNTGAFTLGNGLTHTVNDIEVSLSSLTASLTSDVSMTSANTFFDGPSVAQGTSGTWLVTGTITLDDGTGANTNYQAKLYDGTTVIASTRSGSGTAGAPGVISLHLSGLITSPAGNLRIAASATTTTGKILFNTTGLSKDSTITAVRVA